jgi:hypothetical protein
MSLAGGGRGAVPNGCSAIRRRRIEFNIAFHLSGGIAFAHPPAGECERYAYRVETEAAAAIRG